MKKIKESGFPSIYHAAFKNNVGQSEIIACIVLQKKG